MTPVLALALALSASALDESADFAEGLRLYNAFEFEKASFRFRAAARSNVLPPADVARASLWLGLSLGQAGDEASARSAFVDALRLDPTLALPEDAPPTLRPIFSDARAAAVSPTPPVEAPPPPPPPADTVPPARAGAPSMPTIVGISLVGAGAAVIAGGAGLGALAVSQAEAARAEHFQEDALSGQREAEGTAMIANVLFVAGGLAAAGGVGTLVAAPFLE